MSKLNNDIKYEKENFEESTIQLAFNISKKLKSQCVAFDFIYDETKPFLVEISYGFTSKVYEKCTGYWDKELNWHEGNFDPYGWMVEGVLKSI